MRQLVWLAGLMGCISPLATLEQEVDGPVVRVEDHEVVVPFDVTALLVPQDGERLPNVNVYWEIDATVVNQGEQAATLRTIVWSDADEPVPTPWDWAVQDKIFVQRASQRDVCLDDVCTSGWALGLESRTGEPMEVTLGGRVWITTGQKKLDRLDTGSTRLDLVFGEAQ